MILGIPKETREGENRVAISTEVTKQMVKAGHQIRIAAGAGYKAGQLDESLKAAGAEIVADNAAVFSSSDVVILVNPPTVEQAAQIKEGAALISFLYAYTQPDLVKVLCERKISAFSMDAVPRISRAQTMDALSSQANLAGYKAVLLGANALGKIFPLLMTAAGSIKPAKVLIFGAGVAGLQAIATAKRLGAIVECTDVRPETKEQVESLGGKFLEVKGEEGVKTEGGYAKEVSAEYLAKQKELVSKHVAEADLVITTALVMGKKAPVLVTADMVRTMKPGSVIVDMAVESGGNCELSEKGKTVVKDGVVLVGETNIPSLLAVNASELYAKNIWALLSHLSTKDGFKWEMEEEVTKGCLITKDGELVHAFTRQIIG
ncbi:MAG TPA: Re/Si-specific NAD(P)(+) transhydrogenase subunit alpha [Catalimonadaceae bacterium]|nr:Re/Si-specific NAD(P)(+) transhydrogenase subunit alpha [Catalimonadaceae bacterium]